MSLDENKKDSMEELNSGTAEGETVEEVEVYETSADILREAGREDPPKKARKMNDYVRMGGSLLIICAVVAMVVSFVNAITVDIIAEAAEREKREAIVRIFGEGTEMTEIEPLAGMNAVYAIEGGGYCVSLYARGFGGNVDMMVGVFSSGQIAGVEIVSHSETPGLGSRVDDAEYLRQYFGQGGKLTIGEEISAISGATISSKAVLAGVNAATSALTEAGLVDAYSAPYELYDGGETE